MSTINDNFEFSKDWTDAGDFPTKEYSEQVVRENIQLLFDELKAYINTNLITAINDNMSRISNLGGGDDVQHDALADDAVWESNIKDGAVTEDKYRDGSITPEKFNATEVNPYINDLAAAVVNSLAVLGVKGNAESTYRKGNVNLTKANIGLDRVENKASGDIRDEIISSDITRALGYTPANNADLSGYVRNVDVVPSIDVEGKPAESKYVGTVIRTMYDAVLNEIDFDKVTDALGYVPLKEAKDLATSWGKYRDGVTYHADDVWASTVIYSQYYNGGTLGDDASVECYMKKREDPEVRIRGDVLSGTATQANPRGNIGASYKRWNNVYCVAVNQSSDKRLKNDINYDTSDYSSLIDDLKPCSFKYKSDEDGKTHTGFIAQDVKEAMDAHGLDSRGIVEGSEEDFYGLNYSEIIAMLVAKVQDLQKQVDELKG